MTLSDRHLDQAIAIVERLLIDPFDAQALIELTELNKKIKRAQYLKNKQQRKEIKK